MKSSNYIKLWKVVKANYYRHFIFIIFFSIIVTFTDMLTIAAIFPFLAALINPQVLFELDLIQPFFVFFNIKNFDEIILPITILFCLSAIIASIFRMLLAYLQMALSQNISVTLKQEIYKKILFQPYKFHFENNSGDLIALILAKAQETSGKVISPFLNIVSSSLIIVSVFTMLIFINPTLTLYSFFFLITIYAIIIYFSKKILNRNSKILSLAENQIVRAMQEGIGGIRDVLLNGLENFYINLLYKNNINLRNSALKINIIGIIPRSIIEGIGLCTIAIIAYFSVRNNLRTDFLIPTLGTLALGAQRMLPLMQQIFKGWSDIKGHEARLDDVIKFLNLEISNSFERNSRDIIMFKNEIYLKNVSFAYKKNGKTIISGLDLKINKGDKIGVFGKTGSGKTTLINLIMGLLQPDSGNIYIDETKLNILNLKSWRMNIAHVPQNIYLSDNSISENIAIGIPKKEINKDLLIESARKAQILDLIENMKYKFETQVGERGIKLSGGQLQRIGIARALYKNASVIILDEATSALDMITEQSIMKMVNELSKELTFIIIAHRISSLENCNKIIELKDGKLIKNYSYNELKSQISKSLL